MYPEPLDMVRQTLSRVENEAMNRALAASGAVLESLVAEVRGNLQKAASDMMAFLGRLPHRLANKVADSYRGPAARTLTAEEAGLVREGYGTMVNIDDIRIVIGPGYSTIALVAFLHGNPAITIGNTIYLSPQLDRNIYKSSDLSATKAGIAMLLHECMHVLQYARIGFAGFGARYAAEMKAHHYNADELYAFWTRNLDFDHETLEGEAEIVGRYAAARKSAGPDQAKIAAWLGGKLKGTGIYER